MRRLLVAGVLVGLAAAGVAARNSPRYSAWRALAAIDAADVTTVKALVNLGAFATVPMELAGAAARADGAAPAASGAELLVALFKGLLTSAAHDVTSPFAEQELERRIATHDLAGLTFGFEAKPGAVLLGPLRQTDYGAILTFEGTCVSRAAPGQRVPTAVGVRFERVDGPWLGYPRDWRAIGLDMQSARAAAATCQLVAP